jgi:hypothetical protein
MRKNVMGEISVRGLRLSAMRALWGMVNPNLREVSIQTTFCLGQNNLEIRMLALSRHLLSARSPPFPKHAAAELWEAMSRILLMCSF